MGVVRKSIQYVGKKVESLKKFKDSILDALSDT